MMQQQRLVRKMTKTMMQTTSNMRNIYLLLALFLLFFL